MEPPDAPETSRPADRGWLRKNPILASCLGCGCLGALLLVALSVVAPQLIDLTQVPPLGVVDGSQLTPRIRAGVEGVVPLEPDEQVLFFYSSSIVSYADDGNLLTDRRVVSWSEFDGAPHIYDYPWDEIDHISVVSMGGFLEDAVFSVQAADGVEFRIIFAPEEGRHEEALEEMRQRTWKDDE